MSIFGKSNIMFCEIFCIDAWCIAYNLTAFLFFLNPWSYKISSDYKSLNIKDCKKILVNWNNPRILRTLRFNLACVKVSSPYHLCVEYFSQLSFDSKMYTKSAAVADFVYTSESNESCEKHQRKDDRITSL